MALVMETFLIPLDGTLSTFMIILLALYYVLSENNYIVC